MPRIPKGDVPSLAFFFLRLLMAGLMLLGVVVGIDAVGTVLRELAAWVR